MINGIAIISNTPSKINNKANGNQNKQKHQIHGIFNIPATLNIHNNAVISKKPLPNCIFII